MKKIVLKGSSIYMHVLHYQHVIAVGWSTCCHLLPIESVGRIPNKSLAYVSRLCLKTCYLTAASLTSRYSSYLHHGIQKFVE